MEFKDSATVAWDVRSPAITVNILKDGAIGILKELAKSKFISFANPTAKEKMIGSKERFIGMNKPVHLGFDLKKMSRDELYEK